MAPTLPGGSGDPGLGFPRWVKRTSNAHSALASGDWAGRGWGWSQAPGDGCHRLSAQAELLLSTQDCRPVQGEVSQMWTDTRETSVPTWAHPSPACMPGLWGTHRLPGTKPSSTNHGTVCKSTASGRGHVHFPLLPSRASLTPSLHSLSLQILEDKHVPILPQLPGPLSFQRSWEASLESCASAVPCPGSYPGDTEE